MAPGDGPQVWAGCACWKWGDGGDAACACDLLSATGRRGRTRLEGPQQVVWLERLEHDFDNLRAATRWSLEQAKAEEAASSSGNGGELALRFGGALQQFWVIRGHVTEGRTFLEEALASSKAIKTPGRAKALKAVARLALVQGDYQRGEVQCEESWLFSVNSETPQARRSPSIY